METDDAPAGFCGQRAVRQPVAGGAATVFRSRDVRNRGDTVAVVGRTAGDRADRRSVGARGAMVRHAARAQRAGVAPVHDARSAFRSRHRRRADGALSRDFRSQADARAGRPVSRRDRGSLRGRVPRRSAPTGRRKASARTAPIWSPTSIEVLRVAACRATRTGRSRPAF